MCGLGIFSRLRHAVYCGGRRLKGSARRKLDTDLETVNVKKLTQSKAYFVRKPNMP